MTEILTALLTAITLLFLAAADANGDAAITVDEIVAAIVAALQGYARD